MFEIITQVPAVGPAYGLIKTGMRVYNSTDRLNEQINFRSSVNF